MPLAAVGALMVGDLDNPRLSALTTAEKVGALERLSATKVGSHQVDFESASSGLMIGPSDDETECSVG